MNTNEQIVISHEVAKPCVTEVLLPTKKTGISQKSVITQQGSQQVISGASQAGCTVAELDDLQLYPLVPGTEKEDIDNSPATVGRMV